MVGRLPIELLIRLGRGLNSDDADGFRFCRAQPLPDLDRQRGFGVDGYHLAEPGSKM